jgi:phosphonate transport system substrate-binding protein
MFSPLVQHLSEQLGRKVKLETPKDFEALWDGVTNHRYDIVHYNQYHYVRSFKEFGYQVILKNEEFGEDTIAGALIVRKDSGIKSIEDLRGKKIVFGGGPRAMMSFIVATQLLRQSGLQEGQYTKDYAISPPNAVFTAYYGHAPAGAAGDVVLKLPVVAEKIDTSKLMYLSRSKKLTHLPWAVKGDMKPALREKIQSVLAKLKDTDQGREILRKAQITGLKGTRDDEYDEHRSIIWNVLRENYCVRNCDTLSASTQISPSKAPLVLGIFPRRAQKLSTRMFKPVADYLSSSLERPVQLATSKNFEEFWDGVQKRRYDIVHYNQFQYIKSHKLYGYEIILKNEEMHEDTLTPAIWVRKDSGINDLVDLKGKKIMFGGGKIAMLSYVGPTHILKQAGLTTDDYQEAFALNPLFACRAMFLGQADACGSGTVLMRLPSVVKAIDTTEVKLLAKGEPITHLPWAVKGSMSPELHGRIQSLLADLENSPEGKLTLKKAALTGLSVASDGEHDAVRRIIKDVFGETY